MNVARRFAIGSSILILITMSSFACSQEKGASQSANELETKPMMHACNQKVDSLFDSFRKNVYGGHSFPELDFDDIPSLLELGKSQQVLTAFPRSPISSQYEATCSEGMIALWLIEGIRGGKGFPSLNALCFMEGQAGKDWTVKSEENHNRVLDAYQKWWATSNGLPVEEARIADPLQGRKLHWH